MFLSPQDTQYFVYKIQVFENETFKYIYLKFIKIRIRVNVLLK